MLRDAKLETVQVEPGTVAAGKMISELNLRSQTGASVVGIDRSGTSIVNPPPHEELLSGDQVLLIGREEQLEAAKTLLAARHRKS
ncbi:MAG: cation:proton antiporter regulatory subunit [Terrimicrobiaceae bacterium]